VESGLTARTGGEADMRRVARVVVSVVLGTAGLVGTSRADEVYRWTDRQGRIHYGNTPVAGAESTGLGAEADDEAQEVESHHEAVDSEATEDEGGGDARYESDSFSAGVSLRRSALERDLRAVRERQRALDERLATLAAAREKNAAGRPETGGVAARADLLSDEEEKIAEEREELEQQAASVREEAAKLREEVTARLGSTPTWWVDLR
jgi:hypothetical protein